MKLFFLLLPAFLFHLWSATPVPALEAETVDRDVPFVATPHEVVARMLEVAGVGPGDRLLDLGCGDGRIVITAAREHGATGVGVDIDPERIAESRSNAAAAGVTDRVRFVQADLFETNLGDPTVVTLYLLPDVNVRLRPRLLSELAPGTRLVSHDFDMGEWAPIMLVRMRGHRIYHWIVPANATGVWEWSRSGVFGEERYRLQLDQTFHYLTGTLTINGRNVPVAGGRLDGDRLHLELPQGMDGSDGPSQLEGRVQGNVLQGEIRTAGTRMADWRAFRDPQTKRPLE